jgi:Ca-activated chloride channel family protein
MSGHTRAGGLMAAGTARRAPLVLAAIVGVVLVVAVKAFSSSGSKPVDSKPISKGGGTEASCTVVHLTASSEKAALLKQIAAGWNGTKVEGTCARVEVVSKASGGAADALARGWKADVDGVRPDVWSPAARSWTGLLQQKTMALDKPNLIADGKPASIATTPLVIAMPKPMAQALGWPSKPLGWGDVLKLAQDPRGWASIRQPFGAFTLGKTNPNYSTSGLNATIGTYVAATGTSSDLTLADLAKPAVQQYAQAVEQAVVHYGDTTLTFLSNLQAADDRGNGLGYISAVAVEEKSVWDYNQGNPSGDPTTLGKHAKPKIPLVAIYPKEGTLLSDSPYAILTAPWVTDPIRKAAGAFLTYVQADAAQKTFTAAAFRTFEGKSGSQISDTNGLNPAEPKLVLSPPAPPVLGKVQSLWNAQRKGARVLLIIDTSGSMADSAGQGGDSKLELAKRAALTALSQFGPKDQVALWSFSTPASGQKEPYRELVPFKLIGANKAALEQAITALSPSGGTALYNTARKAFRIMSAGATRDTISAVVLLTDGKNEYTPDNDVASLDKELSPEDTSKSVRFFTIGYGGDADLPTLRGIALASRGAAYDASDPASIDKVFTSVLSNF